MGILNVYIKCAWRSIPNSDNEEMKKYVVCTENLTFTHIHKMKWNEKEKKKQPATFRLNVKTK